MAEDSLVVVGPQRTTSETKAGGRWRADADDERMRQWWNPRMWGADGGEDGGGGEERAADSETLECCSWM